MNNSNVTKNQLDLSIIPIKIVMYTNIPGNYIVEFNRGLLYHPELDNKGVMNKYPYFTNLYRYNEEEILHP
jgi:hypothetical protein